MPSSTFIAVGENIHCTRVYKVGGKFVKKMNDGRHGIVYSASGKPCFLPVPDAWTSGADWQAGKVKHCAVAIWQGNYGRDADKEEGIRFIRQLARSQEDAGASYLDINVDEFSTDVEERVRLMRWTVNVVQQESSLPVSIDSSNPDILQAGLETADPKRRKPMINSVSLERMPAVDLAKKHGAVVIASAAGEKGLPASTEEKLANLDRLIPRLRDAGLRPDAIHVDPLVFPISTDGCNGNRFLEACTAVRNKYGKDIHIVAGLSNVSFGMPARKLINQVFAHLAVQAGADGGIVDPLQINASVLEKMDTASEAYGFAHALLTGEDEFGMNYLTAFREGKFSE